MMLFWGDARNRYLQDKLFLLDFFFFFGIRIGGRLHAFAACRAYHFDGSDSTWTPFGVHASEGTHYCSLARAVLLPVTVSPVVLVPLDGAHWALH